MDLAQWTTRAPVAWAVLVTAGMLEVVWLVALKRSVSATQPLYGVASVVIAWLSFALLAVTLRTIPAGTGYGVWTGVRSAGGGLAGSLLFGGGLGERLCIEAISAVTAVERSSPLVVGMEAIVAALGRREGLDKPREFEVGAFASESGGLSASYPLTKLLWLPYLDLKGAVIGGALHARTTPWTAPEIAIAEHIAGSVSRSLLAVRSAGRCVGDPLVHVPVFAQPGAPIALPLIGALPLAAHPAVDRRRVPQGLPTLGVEAPAVGVFERDAPLHAQRDELAGGHAHAPLDACAGPATPPVRVLCDLVSVRFRAAQ